MSNVDIDWFQEWKIKNPSDWISYLAKSIDLYIAIISAFEY